jgi:protein-disulfide isomerase
MRNTRRRIAFAAGLVVACLGAQVRAQAQVCSAPLPDDKRQAVLEYIRKKYKLPESVALTFKGEQFVNSTCYRELTFQGKSPVRSWELTLYMPPDERFLTGELFDTSSDPLEEERRKNEAVTNGLTQGNVPTLGPASAPVTIVEFSDFQCPFCRKFAQMLQGVLAENRDRIRVVFHHLPLADHAWAMAAAEGAACAQLQSSSAFWTLHDRLFAEQEGITPDNIKKKLAEFARAAGSIDLQSFQRCLDDQMSLGLVFRDQNLASANQIVGTPTLFINGRRVAGVKDANGLRELVATAEKEARPTGPSGAASKH